MAACRLIWSASTGLLLDGVTSVHLIEADNWWGGKTLLVCEKVMMAVSPGSRKLLIY